MQIIILMTSKVDEVTLNEYKALMSTLDAFVELGCLSQSGSYELPCGETGVLASTYLEPEMTLERAQEVLEEIRKGYDDEMIYKELIVKHHDNEKYCYFPSDLEKHAYIMSPQDKGRTSQEPKGLFTITGQYFKVSCKS